MAMFNSKLFFLARGYNPTWLTTYRAAPCTPTQRAKVKDRKGRGKRRAPKDRRFECFLDGTSHECGGFMAILLRFLEFCLK